MKEIAKSEASDDEINDNSLAIKEEVFVLSIARMNGSLIPRMKVQVAATKPKRRASTQKHTLVTPTHKSKRARRAMKQESVDETNDASSESEEVVVVDSEEDDWATEGKDENKSAGPKRRTLARVAQGRK